MQGPAGQLGPQLRWLSAVNTSVTDIEPFAPCTITGFQSNAAGEFVYFVEPCSSDGIATSAVAWHLGIPGNSGKGLITQDSPVWIAVDPSASDPASGELWGPQSGQQHLVSGGSGYRSLGDYETHFTVKVGQFERVLGGQETDVDIIWCKPYSDGWAIGEVVYAYKEVTNPDPNSHTPSATGLTWKMPSMRQFLAYSHEDAWAQHVTANGLLAEDLPKMSGIALEFAPNSSTNYHPVAIGGVVPATVFRDGAINPTSDPKPKYAYIFPHLQGDVSGRITRCRYLRPTSSIGYWQAPNQYSSGGTVSPDVRVHDDWWFAQSPRARIVSWENWNNETPGGSIAEGDKAWVELLPVRTKDLREVFVNNSNQSVTTGNTLSVDFGAKSPATPDRIASIDVNGHLAMLQTTRVKVWAQLEIEWSPANPGDEVEWDISWGGVSGGASGLVKRSVAREKWKDWDASSEPRSTAITMELDAYLTDSIAVSIDIFITGTAGQTLTLDRVAGVIEKVDEVHWDFETRLLT